MMLFVLSMCVSSNLRYIYVLDIAWRIGSLQMKRTLEALDKIEASEYQDWINRHKLGKTNSLPILI